MADIEALKQNTNLLNFILNDNPTCRAKRSGTTTQLSPCPFCNKGIKTPHFSVYEQSNSFATFGCTKNGINGGSIIDYLMATRNIDKAEATKMLCDINGIAFNEPTAREQREKPQEKKPSKEELQQASEFIEQGIKQMQEQDKQKLADYLSSRNIDKAAIDKYNLFIANERVYIPIYEQGIPIAYIGRAIDSNAKLRYKNSSGTMQPFNIDYLSTEAAEESEPLFICEGIFDAISIEEQGKKAIALNSTSNVNKLINAIKSHQDTASKYKFIIATDNDKARTRCKRRANSRIDKAKHSKQLFENTKQLQGRKRVVQRHPKRNILRLNRAEHI